MTLPQRQDAASSGGAWRASGVTSIVNRALASRSGEPAAQREVAVRHDGDAAPAPARVGSNTSHSASCARRLPRPGDAAGIHVGDRRRAVAHEFEQPHEPGQDVERFEPGDDHGEVMAFDERLEHAPARDGCRVPGREKPLYGEAGRRGHDVHRGRNVLVRRENGEVVGQPLQHDRGRGHRRRLEAGGEEDHRLVEALGQVDRLSGAVDHVNLRAFGLGVRQRHDGARHAQHVAVRRDVHALQRERHPFVHLPGVGDAHRAARAHDDPEGGRERRAQAVLRDGLLVAAAHVHQRHPRPPDLGRDAPQGLDHRPGADRVAELQFTEGRPRIRSRHRAPFVSRQSRTARRRP